MLFGFGILGLVYVFISYGIHLDSLKSSIIAVSYFWGLGLAIYLMGHGLVAIPRGLIRDASMGGKLRRIQASAPKLHEKLEESEMKLDDLEIQVSELSRRKVGTAVEFQDWIEELMDLTNQPESQPRASAVRGSGEERRVPTVITEKFLAGLTRDLTRAKHARSRYASEWNFLLQDAVETQAILDSGASKKLDFGHASPSSTFWDNLSVLNPYTRYLLHFQVMPYAKLLFGGFLALASVCIVWSEIVKVAPGTALPKLSVIRVTVVHHWTGDKGQVGFAGQIIAALWIVSLPLSVSRRRMADDMFQMYMCAAALISITEVKAWRGRALVRRNTAWESAFWYSSYVARLSVPLSYNFITFLSTSIYEKTRFYDFLGRLIDLTPLGFWGDTIFPLLILIPVCATLFGLYGKVKRFVGLADIIDDGDEENETGYGTGSWREGRDLIEREISGTSISRREAAAARLATGYGTPGRSAPILSVPGARQEGGRGGISSPLGTSPNVRGGHGATSAAASSSRRFGQRSLGNNGSEEDDNFFASLGHRIKNTVDTIDTPKWLQDIGQGIKKPKWMGDDEGSGAGPARNNNTESDIRRWFGGNNDGRIRL